MSMLAWWSYRKDEVCGIVGNLSWSVPDNICGTLPTRLSACFWPLQFLAPRTWFFCPRYRALSPFHKTSILMLSTVISFAFSLSWLLSIFVLSGWIPRPTASVLVLNSHNISRNLSSDVEKSSTSSANLRFIRQSSVLSLSLIPFCFSCLRFRSLSKENCNTVLKSRLDKGSPCFVLRLIGNMSLSLSVNTVPACWL